MGSDGGTVTVVGPLPSAGGGWRGPSFTRRAWRQIAQLVASTFGIWSRVWARSKLGPGLGFFSEGLTELGEDVCPGFFPPEALRAGIDPQVLGSAEESGATKLLARASAWAVVLEHRVQGAAAPPGTVRTAYGFIRVGGRVRLSVVRYIQPILAFPAARQRPITLMGWDFPVVVRPWLPVHHQGGFSDGNCWVRFRDEESGQRRVGILAANHTIEPKDARLGDEVSIVVLRRAGGGRLRQRSFVMDGAVVEIDDAESSIKQTVPNQSAMGYHPVTLISGRGNVDAEVKHITGFAQGAVIPGAYGHEPNTGVILYIDKALDHGDSGCLVVDREPAKWGGPTPPYLLYLGEIILDNKKVEGFGQLLEQVRRVWDLEFLSD